MCLQLNSITFILFYLNRSSNLSPKIYLFDAEKKVENETCCQYSGKEFSKNVWYHTESNECFKIGYIKQKNPWQEENEYSSDWTGEQ